MITPGIALVMRLRVKSFRKSNQAKLVLLLIRQCIILLPFFLAEGLTFYKVSDFQKFFFPIWIISLPAQKPVRLLNASQKQTFAHGNQLEQMTFCSTRFHLLHCLYMEWARKISCGTLNTYRQGRNTYGTFPGEINKNLPPFLNFLISVRDISLKQKIARFCNWKAFWIFNLRVNQFTQLENTYKLSLWPTDPNPVAHLRMECILMRKQVEWSLLYPENGNNKVCKKASFVDL